MRLRSFGERGHEVHLQEELLPHGARLDVLRPTRNQWDAMSAFPAVGLLTEQFTVGSVPGFQRFAFVGTPSPASTQAVGGADNSAGEVTLPVAASATRQGENLFIRETF